MAEGSKCSCGHVSAPAAFACESCEQLLHLAAGSSRRRKVNTDVASAVAQQPSVQGKERDQQLPRLAAGSGQRSKASGADASAVARQPSVRSKESEHQSIKTSCSCCTKDCWTKENAEIRSQPSAFCDSFQIKQVEGKGRGLFYAGVVPIPTGKIMLVQLILLSLFCDMCVHCRSILEPFTTRVSAATTNMYSS